ncbi:hypothetical protein [Haloferax sp. DFSO52]|uniref:hypothetical protein n=1 Tax=Haloferax sp. DFSO52 TaxID=3388505 RepID=UPI003A884330
MRAIAHLPHRPVRSADIQQLNDSDHLYVVPYGGVEEDGEMHIYALKLLTGSTAHALGFDDSAQTWQQLSSTEAANIADTEQNLDDSLDDWVRLQYGDRFEVTKLS